MPVFRFVTYVERLLYQGEEGREELVALGLGGTPPQVRGEFVRAPGQDYNNLALLAGLRIPIRRGG